MTPTQRKQDTIQHRAMKKAEKAQVLDDHAEEQYWNEQTEQAELLNPVHEVRMRSDNAGSGLAIAKSVKELRAIEKAYILSYRDMCVDPTSEWFGWTFVNKQGRGHWPEHLEPLGGNQPPLAEEIAEEPTAPVEEPATPAEDVIPAFERLPAKTGTEDPLVTALRKQLGHPTKWISFRNGTYYFKREMKKKYKDCQDKDAKVFVEKVVKIMKETFGQYSLFI